MATISKPTDWNPGDTLSSGDLNNDFDTIYNDYNGNIDNSNIASAAAIGWTKVSKAGSKLSDLADLNVGAVANGQTVVWNSSTSQWDASTTAITNSTVTATDSVATSSTTYADLTTMTITSTIASGKVVLLMFAGDWTVSRGSGVNNATVSIYDSTAATTLVPEVTMAMTAAGTAQHSPVSIHAIYTIPSGVSRTFKVQHKCGDASTTSTFTNRRLSLIVLG